MTGNSSVQASEEEQEELYLSSSMRWNIRCLAALSLSGHHTPKMLIRCGMRQLQTLDSRSVCVCMLMSRLHLTFFHQILWRFSWLKLFRSKTFTTIGCHQPEREVCMVSSSFQARQIKRWWCQTNSGLLAGLFCRLCYIEKLLILKMMEMFLCLAKVSGNTHTHTQTFNHVAYLLLADSSLHLFIMCLHHFSSLSSLLLPF